MPKKHFDVERNDAQLHSNPSNVVIHLARILHVCLLSAMHFETISMKKANEPPLHSITTKEAAPLPVYTETKSRHTTL